MGRPSLGDQTLKQGEPKQREFQWLPLYGPAGVDARTDQIAGCRDEVGEMAEAAQSGGSPRVRQRRKEGQGGLAIGNCFTTNYPFILLEKRRSGRCSHGNLNFQNGGSGE